MKVPLRHAAEADAVLIVSDATVATRAYADGRLIPLLILDTSKRPDIDAMILAHRDLGPGDATSMWGQRSRFESQPTVRLVMSFSNPSACNIILDFDITSQGGLVDQIIQMEGVYLLGGRPGDRLLTKIDDPKISVEVPSRHFRTEWDRRLRKATFQKYRAMGLSRADAKHATDSFIREWRELGSHRMDRDPIITER
jgi:hypothetical protein